MPVYAASNPTDMPGPGTLVYWLLSVLGAGCVHVSAAVDGLGIDTGDPFPAGSLAPPLCSFPAVAFSTGPTGAACPVTVCLSLADGLCSVVPHASSAVHLTPSAWVSHWLAHASGLQWPALLGTPLTNHDTCGVSAHPGEPSAPNGAYSQAAGPLRGFPSGATCSLAGHTTTSHAWLPSPCHQGLGCYPSYGAPPWWPPGCCPCLLATVCAAPRRCPFYCRSLHRDPHSTLGWLGGGCCSAWCDWPGWDLGDLAWYPPPPLCCLGYSSYVTQALAGLLAWSPRYTAADSLGGLTGREVLGHSSALALSELADCQLSRPHPSPAGGTGSSCPPDSRGWLPLVPTCDCWLDAHPAGLHRLLGAGHPRG